MALGGRGRGWPKRGPQARLKPSTPGDTQQIIPRAPYYTRYWPRSPWVAIGSQPAQWQMPVAVQQDPFKQTDWPLPRRSSVQPPMHPQNLLALTIDANPAGAAIIEWPVPVRPQRHVSLLTFSNNLLLTTLAGVQAAPFAQFDWPTPRARARTPEHPQQNLLLTTLASGQAAPFVQTDWPSPRAARRAQPDAVQNLLTTTLAPAADVPIVPPVFPLPGRARHPVGSLTWTVNLLQTTLDPAPLAPFRQTDWPTIRRAGARDPWIAPNLLTSTLAQADDNPAGAVINDWPVPPRRPFQNHDIAPNLLLTTLAGVQQAPFTQTQWPTFVRAPFQRPDIAPNLVLPTFFTPAVLPPGQQYFANPVRARGRIENLTFICAPQLEAPPPDTGSDVWIHRARRRGNR